MQVTSFADISTSLYQSAFRGARSVIQSRLVDGADADEIASETIKIIFEKNGEAIFDSINVNTLNARAFMIAKNRAIDATRGEVAASKRNANIARLVDKSSELPGDQLAHAEFQYLMQKEMLSLTFEEAFSLFCRFWMGLSTKAVVVFWTELTGEQLSEKTHSTRLKEAKDRLRKRLDSSASKP